MAEQQSLVTKTLINTFTPVSGGLLRPAAATIFIRDLPLPEDYVLPESKLNRTIITSLLSIAAFPIILLALEIGYFSIRGKPIISYKERSDIELSATSKLGSKRPRTELPSTESGETGASGSGGLLDGPGAMGDEIRCSANWIYRPHEGGYRCEGTGHTLTTAEYNAKVAALNGRS